MSFERVTAPNVSGPPTGADMDLVSSHQRLLIGSVLRTQGAILELGCGWYSTPILHEMAEALQRPLLTVDNNIDWLSQFLCLKSTWHRLFLVGWWGELWPSLSFHPDGREWGVAFIDQGQPIEREYAIRAMLSFKEEQQPRVFVMHDTEEGFAYGYNRTLPMFKWKYTDKCQKVWTTVASNFLNVEEWFSSLPAVEPTKEVT